MEREIDVNRIRKISSVLMTAVFVTALCAAMLIFIFSKKDDVSYYENRSLADLPELEVLLIGEVIEMPDSISLSQLPSLPYSCCYYFCNQFVLKSRFINNF